RAARHRRVGQDPGDRAPGEVPRAVGWLDRPGVQGVRVLTASADAADFIRAHTAIASPALCPEIRLHLADKLIPTWEAVGRHLARTDAAPPYWAFCWPGGQALTRYVLDQPRQFAGK